MGWKLKENLPNDFQGKLGCCSHQGKYFCYPSVKVNGELF